ncbi:MAG: hypothetical protein K0Q76_708 [Panacagrimonas sp.]|jgi:hypothetical protein|nr:DUF1302 family protein [Panacagrimonas sp.]MCC2655600.1 hypothetical protein [Panacagrimonas sp.]
MLKTLARASTAIAGLVLLLPQAHAINFEYGGAEFQWTTKMTAGAAWRMEARDVGKIGKLNVPGQQFTCSNSTTGNPGDILGTNNGQYDDDCISLFGDPAPNLRLKHARGGYFAALMDDGNLNYDNGDLVSSIFKINTQLGATWGDWTIKLNYVGFYDDTNYNLNTTHTNTNYQKRRERRGSSVQGRSGLKGEFREAFILRNFEIGERGFSIAVGQQRVRWGEANLHLFNTADAINPLDSILALQPGFNLNELAVPTGMVLFTADIIENVSAELIYQYDWDTTRVQPSGTFFSSADPAGIDTYRPVLSLGQFPEDPDNEFIPALPFRALSSSTRNAPVFENGRPAKDSGQYGIRINWYAENFNDGTEFGAYYLNYHSRVPYFSIIEAQATCLRNIPQVPGIFNPVTALAGCGTFNPYLPGAPTGGNLPQFDPLPINTSTLLLDYPEDIHMFGLSFNTTALGWSVSGEYTYRPNLPAQVLISDVFYAGYQQAFAQGDVGLSQATLAQALGVATGQNIPVNPLTQLQLALLGQLPPLPTVVGPILPGAETFIPSYLTQYRGRTIANGNEYQPGEYVKGFERLKVGQFVINALKLFPSTLGADDVTFLAEFGFTHIVDMPKPGDIYFQGTLEHTHPSPGADCTGFGPGTNCSDPKVVARVNPTQQRGDFAEDFAAGVRFLLQFNYSNFLNSGINVKPTLLWFEDIYGTTIFPVQNYVEGNRWIIPGFQFEIGQEFNGTILYQHFDGADNALQDRDNLSLSLTYNF